MQETTKETEVKDQAEQNTVQEPQAEKGSSGSRQPSSLKTNRSNRSGSSRRFC